MDSDKVIKGLKKLKFVEDNKRDHRYFTTELSGLKIQTKVSHGPKCSIGPKLFSKIAKDIFINTPFFNEVCKCNYQRNDYEKYTLNPEI